MEIYDLRQRSVQNYDRSIAESMEKDDQTWKYAVFLTKR